MRGKGRKEIEKKNQKSEKLGGKEQEKCMHSKCVVRNTAVFVALMNHSIVFPV